MQYDALSHAGLQQQELSPAIPVITRETKQRSAPWHCAAEPRCPVAWCALCMCSDDTFNPIISQGESIFIIAYNWV